MKKQEIALIILRDHWEGIGWQAGSFLGQICACPERPFSEKQAAWFQRLVHRAGLSAESIDA